MSYNIWNGENPARGALNLKPFQPGRYTGIGAGAGELIDSIERERRRIGLPQEWEDSL